MGVPTQAKPVAWPGRAAKRPASGSDARLDETTLDRFDRLVKRSVFPSRRQAIQIAIEEKPDRIERGRFARECAKPTATSRSRSPRRACRRICRHGPHRRIALSPSRTASEASCLVAGSHHLEMVAPPPGSPPIAFGPSHITRHRVLFPKSHRHPTTHNPSSVNHFRPHATTAHSTINCTPRNYAEQEKYELYLW